MLIEHINGERIVLLGWSRAILLQLAHPLVAAGVLGHSAFRGSVLDAAVRLHHTVSSMLALTFGTDDRRRAAVARIRGIHRSVHGTLPDPLGPFPAGTPYSADDPALLLWVHATLVDSTIDVYDRLVSALDDDARDCVCVESLPLLAELGGDAGAAPHDWRSLQRYLTSLSDTGVLAVSEDARTLGRAVLSPRAAGLPVPFGGLHRVVTLGLLPPGIRAAYGFEWSDARQRRFERTLVALRTLRRLTPSRLARWPDARRLDARRKQERAGHVAPPSV